MRGFKVLRASDHCACGKKTAALVWVSDIHNGEVTGGDWKSFCAEEAIAALRIAALDNREGEA